MERRTSPDHDANIGMLLQPAQWSVGVAINHVWANRRRKFKSQTSDDMDKWSSRGGMIQRREEKRRGEERSGAERRGEERREEIRSEKRKGQKKEDKKVENSRHAVFFQCFVVPEGRKVCSLKRQVRSHLGRGALKNCMPLWAEAHLEVNTFKTHHVWSTFGSWDVKKVHAVVARSAQKAATATATTTTTTTLQLQQQLQLHYLTLHYTTNYNYHYTATTA